MRIILASILFLLLAPSASAVTTSITDYPSTISEDPFTLGVKVEGNFDEDTNYYRIEFFKTGSTDYFGETNVDGTWVKLPDELDAKPFVMTGTVVQFQLEGQIGADPGTAFGGDGAYMLRVRRYTASGNPDSSSLKSEVPITIQTNNSPSQNSAPHPTPTPTSVQSLTDIKVTEAYIAPKTGEDEWIELYNNSDNIAEIVDWFIDDIPEGGSAAKKITLTIPAKSYGVIFASSAMFNNSGDSIRLLDSNQKLVDGFDYTESEAEKSIGVLSLTNNSICIQNPSRERTNTSCLVREESETTNTEKKVAATVTKKPTATPKSPTPAKLKPTTSSPFKNALQQFGIQSGSGQPTSTSGAIMGAYQNSNGDPAKKAIFLAATSGFVSILNIGYITGKIKGWWGVKKELD